MLLASDVLGLVSVVCWARHGPSPIVQEVRTVMLRRCGRLCDVGGHERRADGSLDQSCGRIVGWLLERLVIEQVRHLESIDANE